MKTAILSVSFSVFLVQCCYSSQSFNPARRDFLVGFNPVGAAILDYNLDGIEDVAVICGRENGVLVIFEGTAEQQLDFVWGIYCGNTPGEIEVLDVNRDTIPDLVVSLSAEGKIRTFYGSVGGQFTAGESLFAGSNPVHLVVTDVEGDGDEELVASGTTRIFIFKRDPRGGLVEFRRHDLLDTLAEFAAGDINGDGYGDIVLAYEREGTHLYFGDGTGQIGSGFKLEQLSYEEKAVVDLKITDIDLDGIDDLLAIDSDGDQFTILWGDGNGGFRQTRVSYIDFTSTSVIAGPVGASGIRDIISVSEETGQIQSHSGRICGVASSGQLSRGKLIAMNDNNSLHHTYCFAEKGRKYQCGLETIWADVCEFSGDGIPDIFALNRGSGSLVLFTGAGDGYYYSAPDFIPGPGAVGVKSVAVLDADEDGHEDVAVAFRSEDGIAIMLGDGGGYLNYSSTFPTGGSGTHTLGVGDLSEDGHDDIIVRNVGSSTVSVLLGDGDANYELAGEYQTDAGTHLVKITDIDMDEHLDVITPNARGGTITVLLGDGTGYLERTADIPVGLGPHSCVDFDFDLDEDPDLATANMDEDSVAILGNDSGILSLVGKAAVGKGPISLCSGDFNEDGYPDLATANIEGFTISVLIGDGNGSFQNLTGDILAGYGPHYVITEDIDRDDHLDLIAPITGMDGVVVLYGDGSGNFVVNERFGVGDNPNTVSAGDFNEDQMPDLVTGNMISSDVSLLINTVFPSGPPILKGY